MKKLIALLLSLSLALSLTACAGATNQPAATEKAASSQQTAADAPAANEEHEPVTIEFFCWGAAEAGTSEAFYGMINGFMEKYPWITVETTESSYNEVSSTLLSRAAAGSAPDVAQVSDQWVAALYETGALNAVSDYLDEATMADYNANQKAGTTINGKNYSVPWITNPMVLFYNKELLSAAGYDAPPTTWESYLEMCDAIAKLEKNADGNVVYGRSFASTALYGAGYFSLVDVWQNGGDFCDANGNIVFNSPETVQAYQQIQDMVKAGAIAPGLPINDNRALFNNGQIGFHIDSFVTSIFTEVDYGIAQIPEKVSFSSDHHLVMFQDSEHPEECALFLDYITGPEGMAIYTSKNEVVSSRASVLEGLDFYKNANEVISAFVEASTFARALPIQSSHFSEAMLNIAEGLERIVVGLEDVETVVSDVSAKLNELY